VAQIANKQQSVEHCHWYGEISFRKTTWKKFWFIDQGGKQNQRANGISINTMRGILPARSSVNCVVDKKQTSMWKARVLLKRQRKNSAED